MRWIVGFTFAILLEIYSFQALRFAWFNNDTSLWWISVVFFGILTLLTIIYIASTLSQADRRWSETIKTRFRSVVVMGYFAKFVMLIFVLIDDIRRGITIMSSLLPNRDLISYDRSELISGMGFMGGTGLFILLVYGLIRNPHRYKVHRHKIALPKLPDDWKPLKIVQISDIHSGSFFKKEPIKKAVELINQQNADLIFFTGDLVNNRADEIIKYLDIFKALQARYGIYSVLGNHDYGDYVQWSSSDAKIKNLERLIGYHQEMGWTLLRNAHQCIDLGNHTIAVIGVENFSAKLRFPKYGDLRTSLAGCPETDLKILLSHDPSHWKFEVIKDYPDIDLTLSGHTHGMQFGFEIPGLVKWSPVQYVYKEWAGIYRERNQYLYVNRGFGYLGYPGRVGILPEITILEIENEN